jgi:cysteine desulfurase
VATYLDHNATSPLDPGVLEVMLPFLRQPHGNATSRHSFGRRAREAVEQAREQVASAAGAHPSQVVLTSGGTESDNFALHGICATLAPSQIAVSAIEHPAVMKPAQALQRLGWGLARIAVDGDGRLDMEALESALRKPTALVSVMMANNETGVIQDIAAIAQLTGRHGALVHTDAVQALGKIPVNFSGLGVHAMSLSAHKIGGPQGAGALVLDKRIDIQPLLHGGGQEKGLRSGTENIAAIAGFGHACTLAKRELAERSAHMRTLRERLESGLHRLGAFIFGEHAERLPNTSFFAFGGIDGETLVMAMDRRDYAVASGSACSSDSSDPSPVLLAMGVRPELALGAVRVSFGPGNTLEQVDGFLQALESELGRMKRMAALAV